VYENFEYVEPSFECSSEKLVAFESELASRLIKLQKKRQYKEKLDEIKAIKQAELEKAEALYLEEKMKQLELERIERERIEAEKAERERKECKHISPLPYLI